MERALSDTDPEAERVHMELLRAASSSRRFRLALSMSQTTMSLALDGLARRFPEASAEEVRLRFVALLYGGTLADEVRAALSTRRS